MKRCDLVLLPRVSNCVTTARSLAASFRLLSSSTAHPTPTPISWISRPSPKDWPEARPIRTTTRHIIPSAPCTCMRGCRLSPSRRPRTRSTPRTLCRLGSAPLGRLQARTEIRNPPSPPLHLPLVPKRHLQLAWPHPQESTLLPATLPRRTFNTPRSTTVHPTCITNLTCRQGRRHPTTLLPPATCRITILTSPRYYTRDLRNILRRQHTVSMATQTET